MYSDDGGICIWRQMKNGRPNALVPKQQILTEGKILAPGSERDPTDGEPDINPSLPKLIEVGNDYSP